MTSHGWGAGGERSRERGARGSFFIQSSLSQRRDVSRGPEGLRAEPRSWREKNTAHRGTAGPRPCAGKAEGTRTEALAPLLLCRETRPRFRQSVLQYCLREALNATQEDQPLSSCKGPVGPIQGKPNLQWAKDTAPQQRHAPQGVFTMWLGHQHSGYWVEGYAQNSRVCSLPKRT